MTEKINGKSVKIVNFLKTQRIKTYNVDNPDEWVVVSTGNTFGLIICNPTISGKSLSVEMFEHQY